MKMKRVFLIAIALSLVAVSAAALIVTNIFGSSSSAPAAAISATITTKIDTYEVVYVYDSWYGGPEIVLRTGSKVIGYLYFLPDGKTLPADSIFTVFYHLADYQNCIDLLRNENPVYFVWVGYGTNMGNGIKTWVESVGEGENAASLFVSNPNGGQSWNRGSVRSIGWLNFGSPGAYVKIELLKGGVLNRTIASSTENDGVFNWTIPAAQAVGTDYKIRITSLAMPAISDTSDNNFAIT